MRLRLHPLVVFFALLPLVVACDRQADLETASPPAAEPSADIPALASGHAPGIPAADPSTEQLPEGHPPIESSIPPIAMPAVPAGAGAGGNALVWTVPGGWIEETPSSSMRRAQYRVPGESGNGECVVFYFGPGQGGGAVANAERWADQFRQPDGRSSREVVKTDREEINGVSVLTTEVTGTYSGGMMMGAPQFLEGYMLLGAVAQGPDANWFFKLTGPETTIRAQRQAFEAMIGSLQVSEQP